MQGPEGGAAPASGRQVAGDAGCGVGGRSCRRRARAVARIRRVLEVPSGISGTRVTRSDPRSQMPSGCRWAWTGGGHGAPCSKGQHHVAVSGWGGDACGSVSGDARRNGRQRECGDGEAEGVTEGAWLRPRRGPAVAPGQGILAWFRRPLGARAAGRAAVQPECPLGGVRRP